MWAKPMNLINILQKLDSFNEKQATKIRIECLQNTSNTWIPNIENKSQVTKQRSNSQMSTNSHR